MKFSATKNTDEHIAMIRQARNRLLYLTDWVFTPESPFSEEEKEQVRVFRTALKDCTDPLPGKVIKIPHYSAFDMPYGVKKFLRDTLNEPD
jgi:hypothetical protein